MSQCCYSLILLSICYEMSQVDIFCDIFNSTPVHGNFYFFKGQDRFSKLIEIRMPIDAVCSSPKIHYKVFISLLIRTRDGLGIDYQYLCLYCVIPIFWKRLLKQSVKLYPVYTFLTGYCLLLNFLEIHLFQYCVVVNRFKSFFIRGIYSYESNALNAANTEKIK